MEKHTAMISNLHFEIFPQEQKDLFNTLLELNWIKNFYLAGGTALAMQIGHRQSIDFDFFTPDNFDTREIIHKLSSIGKFELFNESGNTINGALNNVRISFFSDKYPLIENTLDINYIRIANPLDISVMKLEAISGRGSKKDFVDLYYILNIFPLNKLFEKYRQKYKLEISNNYHLMKSLIYFEDAEQQPMPVMIDDISWVNIKKSLVLKIKEFSYKF